LTSGKNRAVYATKKQLQNKFLQGDIMKNCDPMEISKTLATQIGKGAFLTVKAGDELNTMTIGWALIGVIWMKPVLMVAVRNSRHTFSIIEKASDFSVSLPLGNDMKDNLMFCGTKSGKNVDKFKEYGLIPLAPQKIISPVLKAAGIHMECKICYKTPMNPAFLDPDLEKLYPAKDYHTLYFGEIMACYEMGAD